MVIEFAIFRGRRCIYRLVLAAAGNPAPGVTARNPAVAARSWLCRLAREPTRLTQLTRLSSPALCVSAMSFMTLSPKTSRLKRHG
jgi:hypothetical protein